MRKLLLRFGLPLLCAAALTLLCASGALYYPDNTLADALYNRPQSPPEEIVVVGLDDRALEEIGPMPWTRDIMAQIIDILNADPAAAPAVIGIDVLYAGETDYDPFLVDAAQAGGNVVVAEAAAFDSVLEVDGGDFRMNDFHVHSYDAAFPALREVTRQGHVNAMLDADGVMRHALLRVDDTMGGETPSLAWSVYEAYCSAAGRQPGPKPKTDSRGFYLLPYSCLPGSFYDGISASDVFFGEFPEDYFAGKIVLIGPYAAGMQDQYVTSIDHAVPMYGVEIQANALAALLEGRLVAEAGDAWQLAALFLLCALCAWVFLHRKLLCCTLVWLCAAVGWLGLCLLAWTAGYLLHPLWVPLSVTLLYVVSVAANYLRAALEKRRLSSTFSRYVDPSVIHELMREGSDSLGLGGKLMDIAVLFVDIRGFTTMSEVLTPPQVVEILNQYLSLTTKCVMENHGTLDKFVGDCTMAIWNAPLPQEDYIMNACKAAMDMVKGSQPLAEKLQKEFGRTVAFGVGVHCGPAVVGNIGAPMRMDYTAIGDTVNTSARLEANAPAGTVYISRAVADALEGRIRTTSLGSSIKLKGKADGFEILTLDEIVDET